MSIEDYDELAQEFAEFGYRETSDPTDADRRNFYKVEKWDEAEVHVEALINASNDWRVQKLSSPPKRRADHAVAFLAALIAKKESPGGKTGP